MTRPLLTAKVNDAVTFYITMSGIEFLVVKRLRRNGQDAWTVCRRRGTFHAARTALESIVENARATDKAGEEITRRADARYLEATRAKVEGHHAVPRLPAPAPRPEGDRPGGEPRPGVLGDEGPAQGRLDQDGEADAALPRSGDGAADAAG